MKVISKVIFSLQMLFIVNAINACPTHVHKHFYAPCTHDPESVGEMENSLSIFLKECFREKKAKSNSDDGYDSSAEEEHNLEELEANDTDYESDIEDIPDIEDIENTEENHNEA